jgi:hypothetical protein
MSRKFMPAVLLSIFLLSFTSLCLAAPKLHFRADGTFKIVQFSDTQDGANTDPRTITAMNDILDAEKPDFVVITGDCVDTGKCQTQVDLRKAIANIAQPMESRGIPWAVTFGNHDHDNLAALKLSENEMLALYRHYPHNVNKKEPRGISGAGNANLLIDSSTAQSPVFGIWLLDSEAYAPKEIRGYDWIHFNQVRWYYETSTALEKRLGAKLPALMFFHIGLCEFKEALAAGKFTGEMNEGVGSSRINSGLFAAVLERGDVKGIFVGHDHIDAGVADYYGVKLGFGGNIGYATYGLEGDETARNRLRGARIFTIDERHPADFKTWYVTAAELEKK